MLKKVKALFFEEQGQGMTEYGLVLGIIAVAVVGIIIAFRNEIVDIFQDALDAIQGRPTGSTGSTPTP